MLLRLRTCRGRRRTRRAICHVSSKQIVLPDRDAFAEMRRRHVALLQHLAGLELDLADRRLPDLAGAFVEHAVDVLKALRERLRDRAGRRERSGSRTSAGSRRGLRRRRESRSARCEHDDHRRAADQRTAMTAQHAPVRRRCHRDRHLHAQCSCQYPATLSTTFSSGSPFSKRRRFSANSATSGVQ